MPAQPWRRRSRSIPALRRCLPSTPAPDGTMEPCHPPAERTPAPPVDRVTHFADRARARPLRPQPFAGAADLRRFVERRLEPALGLRVVATEVPVDGWASGRIDALAVDERNRPVVVEF